MPDHRLIPFEGATPRREPGGLGGADGHPDRIGHRRPPGRASSTAPCCGRPDDDHDRRGQQPAGQRRRARRSRLPGRGRLGGQRRARGDAARLHDRGRLPHRDVRDRAQRRGGRRRVDGRGGRAWCSRACRSRRARWWRACPAKVRRPLTDEEVAGMRQNADHYVDMGRRHAAARRAESPGASRASAPAELPHLLADELAVLQDLQLHVQRRRLLGVDDHETAVAARVVVGLGGAVRALDGPSRCRRARACSFRGSTGSVRRGPSGGRLGEPGDGQRRRLVAEPERGDGQLGLGARDRDSSRGCCPAAPRGCTRRCRSALITRVTMTAFAATSDSVSYTGTTDRPMATVA